MPLYEYECAKCGRFEKIHKFSDKSLKTCPTCKGKKIERLLSAPAIQFKGSGWYITDYARKNGKSADSKAKAESKADKASDSKKADSSSSSRDAPSKGDAKPDAKPDAKTDSGKKPASPSKS